MNAQEAIERIEKLLGSYSERLGELQRKDEEPEKIKEAESLHEALSIVLKTAKVFHSTEPQEGPRYYYFDSWHIKKNALHEIGVLLEGQTNLFDKEVNTWI